jgi:hypothetical protein
VAQNPLQDEGVVDVGKIALSTLPNPIQSGLKGYNVYVSEVSGGRFEKVNGVPLSNVPTYLVRHLKVGQRYYFQFTQVGNEGSESSKTPEIQSIALPYNTASQGAAPPPPGAGNNPPGTGNNMGLPPLP